MSRFALIIIGFAIVILLYFGITSLKQSYKLLPIQSAKKVDTVPFSDWHQFKAPTGKFSVMLPVLPQHATQHLTDPKTKEPRVYDMYVAQNESQTIFMISLIKFSDKEKSSPEMLEKTIINDMLKSNPQNKLKNLKDENYQGFKALNFTIENDQMVIHGKTFMDGPILYLISGIFNKQSYNPKDYDYFVSSFQLPKSKALSQ